MQNGVRPNPYGELVLAAARDITRRYDQLREDLAGLLDPDDWHGPAGFHGLHGDVAGAAHPARLPPRGAAHPGRAASGSPDTRCSATSPLACPSGDHLAAARRPGTVGCRLQRQRLMLVVPVGHRLAAAPPGAAERTGGGGFRDRAAPASGSAHSPTDCWRRRARRPGVVRDRRHGSPSKGWSAPGWGWPSCPSSSPALLARSASRSPPRTPNASSASSGGPASRSPPRRRGSFTFCDKPESPGSNDAPHRVVSEPACNLL